MDKTTFHRYGGGKKGRNSGKSEYRKLKNCIVAIDAEKFHHSERWQQYRGNKLKRELLKSYTGFSIPTKETNLGGNSANEDPLWIATGNWGCGVFGGDIELKVLVQWMAASLAGRKVRYFGFGDKGCVYVQSFVEIAKRNALTVGEIWNYLNEYAEFRKMAYRHNPNAILSVFQWIVSHKLDGDQNKLVEDKELNKKESNDVSPGPYKKESHGDQLSLPETDEKEHWKRPPHSNEKKEDVDEDGNQNTMQRTMSVDDDGVVKVNQANGGDMDLIDENDDDDVDMILDGWDEDTNDKPKL